MIWDYYLYYAACILYVWFFSAFFALVKNKPRVSLGFTVIGFLVLGIFIVNLWIALERPPFRTMGETRIWYAFFLSFLGIVAYLRWKYTWLMGISSLFAGIFVLVNLYKPELYSKSLMPALQSYWFVPHVTVYIFSYALLGVCFLASVKFLYQERNKELDKRQENTDNGLLGFIDNIVYIGFGFLMLGLLFGAFWAKEAWGHYWSWDPKETWAFITVAGYLIYIHLRLRKISPCLCVSVIPCAFVLLLITWLGVSYLPTAPTSIHVY